MIQNQNLTGDNFEHQVATRRVHIMSAYSRMVTKQMAPCNAVYSGVKVKHKLFILGFAV
jgi:hypothetical protein